MQYMSNPPLPFRQTIPLLVAQLIGAFNDNAVKALLPVLAAYQFGKESMDLVNQQVSILLILPFVLFAPWAGWVSDRYPKRKVVGASLLAQLIGLGGIVFGVSQRSLPITLTGFFLLSTQSTFLSPAKKGILKEIVGYGQLGKAVGWMEMLTIVGILGGAFSGAVLFDYWAVERGGWETAQHITLGICFLALVSWVVFLPTPSTEAPKAAPFTPYVLFSHFRDLGQLVKRPNLRWAALGDACFWAVGGFFYLVLVKLSGEVTVGKVGMGSLYGYWFLLLGLGIMAGCLFCAYLNKGRIELGLCPMGAGGMALSLWAVYLSNPLSGAFECGCASLGFFGALFFVPLNGYLQYRAGEDERGRILAVSNLLTQLGGVALIGLHAWFSNVLGLGAKEEVLILIFPLGVIALISLICQFEDFLRACFHLVLRIFYRIRVVGMENFPDHGGALIVSNHLSYADPVFIGAAFPRKVRYLAHDELGSSKILRGIFRLTRTLTLSPDHSLSALRRSIKRVSSGTPLCLFAEGGISRLGITLPFQRGFLLLAKHGRVPIVPAHLDGVWGSIYSHEGGRFFKKFPRSFPYRISVRCGSPIDAVEASPESVRRAVLDLGRLSFNERLLGGRDARHALRKRIFQKQSGVMFRDREGVTVSRADFLKAVQGGEGEWPEPYRKWAEVVNCVLQDTSNPNCLPWTNWMRLRETNLVDHPRLKILACSQVWEEQWFPWFPLLAQVGFEQTASGDWVQIVEGTPLLSWHSVSGFATTQSGLVSVQLPDEDSPSNHQLGYKEKTLGRLLPGYSYRLKDNTFVLQGREDGEELGGVQGTDEDGFLVPKTG
jgi:acyl-[acyl-carrier-protein]-phospholipid O-acyltransferase/long-chain-fatty-acid--[acyl-carrier-protein] ligase